MEIRPIRADDAAAAGELVAVVAARTPYGELPRLALERALAGGSDEALALVAVEGEQVHGLVLYGLVAGARGAGRLALVRVREPERLQGTGAGLLAAAADDLRARGARFWMVEVPSDPVVRPGLAALERAGFRLESRVRDFYRDGVDQLLLRDDF